MNSAAPRRMFTSDTHYGHANIIKYCDRPFGNTAEMDAALLDAARSDVDADDEFWHLGDLAMGDAKQNLGFVARMPGHKILVVGNHDRPFRRSGDPRPHLDVELLDAGFAQVVHGSTTVTIGKHNLLVCHFPYRGDSSEEERYANQRPVDRGQWMLHGHVHEMWRQKGRMINVGVDAWAGRPVTEEQILELIDAGPRDLAPLRWV